MVHLAQWQAGLSLSLAVLIAGFAKGWTSPYIAQLTDPHSTDPLKLTPSEASWIASLLFLGRVFGCVFGATVQGLIGRKKTLLYSGGPMVIGWMCVLIATSVVWLYVGRFFCGLSTGMIFSALTLFLGEISDPKIRGTLMLWNMNMLMVGTFLGNAMGTLLTMKIFAQVSLGITVIFIVLFALVPESPYHHIANNDTKRAEKSLKWYTGSTDVREELQELRKFVGDEKTNFANRFDELIRNGEYRRSLLIVCGLGLFTVCSGQSTVSSYAEIILIKSKTSIEPSLVVMASSFFIIVASFLTTIFIDKCGRRPLLMASGSGVCVSQIILASHFHMIQSNIDPKLITWVPIFALFLYYFSMSAGLGTIPQALVGELFPPSVKTPATLCYSMTTALLPFFVLKGFQPYVDLVGEKFVFMTFAVSAMFSVLLTYFCVPETKKMSLVEIQARNCLCPDAENVEKETRI